MKKGILVTILTAAVLVGCSQDETLNQPYGAPAVYTGSMEETTSRVLLDQSYMMNWEMDDKLTIFPQYDINNLYKVSAINNGLATFQHVDYVDNPDYSEVDYTYAVYPYYESNSLSGEVITTEVPAEVEYTNMENSIKHALMSARSKGSSLTFTNAQGILHLRLNAMTPFQYGAIQSVKIESNANKLSGKATIDYSESGTPEAKIAADGNNSLFVTLSQDLQKELPASKNEEWAEFYIPVVPTTFEVDDMTLTINWTDGTSHVKAVPLKVTVQRKKIYTLSYTLKDVPTYEGSLEGAEETADATIE